MPCAQRPDASSFSAVLFRRGVSKGHAHTGVNARVGLSVPSLSLTVLRAGSQQVDDVLVLADDLHHLHLRDEVRQVLLGGVRCTQRGGEVQNFS